MPSRRSPMPIGRKLGPYIQIVLRGAYRAKAKQEEAAVTRSKRSVFKLNETMMVELKSEHQCALNAARAEIMMILRRFDSVLSASPSRDLRTRRRRRC